MVRAMTRAQSNDCAVEETTLTPSSKELLQRNRYDELATALGNRPRPWRRELPSPADGLAQRASVLACWLGASRSSQQFGQLLGRLQGTLAQLQSAPDASTCLNLSAKALAENLGSQWTAALIRQAQAWEVSSLVPGRGEQQPCTGAAPDASVLEQVCRDRAVVQTVVDPGVHGREPTAVLAVPLLDRQGDVQAALYAVGQGRAGTIPFELSELAGSVAELLATGAAAAWLSRMHEQQAIEHRTRFEQFFSPELASVLEKNAGLLLPVDHEVTMLCCGIRDFGHTAQQLGARLAHDWVNDVMGTLFDCVRAQGGLVIDTWGDEIFALWGAPIECDDHAARACTATRAIFAAQAQIERRWQRVLHAPLEFSAGIHTGRARLGNVGSLTRLKYGPVGTAVTHVRRVYQATEHLETPVVVSAATVASLPEDFCTRRLHRDEPGEQAEPLELHELALDSPQHWAQLKQRFEAALDCYAVRDLPTATRLLGQILSDRPHDRPARNLLAKVSEVW